MSQENREQIQNMTHFVKQLTLLLQLVSAMKIKKKKSILDKKKQDT